MIASMLSKWYELDKKNCTDVIKIVCDEEKHQP
jgi:hypothetical protein